MRVVVAGSSGLIGTRLVPALRSGGHDVLRLVRRTAHAPDEREWDPNRGDVPSDALDEADAVVNLCGAGIAERRWNAARKRTLLHSRLRPTTVLARAVSRHGVPVLVNASAVGFYGDTGAHPVTETSPAGTGFIPDLCQRWERAAGEAEARVVVLRTGLVLVAGGGLLGRLRPLFACGLGARLGAGTQFMPWISLEDEVAAIRFVLERPEISGPVNLTGPAPVTNAEFTRNLAEHMHRPAPWVIPGFALRAALGELSGELLGGQRALPTELEGRGFTFTHPTLSAALAAALGARSTAQAPDSDG
ncbi:TIGR01777 family oxidoreductase [Salinifilum ghardaiensis]